MLGSLVYFLYKGSLPDMSDKNMTTLQNYQKGRKLVPFVLQLIGRTTEADPEMNYRNQT